MKLVDGVNGNVSARSAPTRTYSTALSLGVWQR